MALVLVGARQPGHDRRGDGRARGVADTAGTGRTACEREAIDLVVIGPEAPLVVGPRGRAAGGGRRGRSGRMRPRRDWRAARRSAARSPRRPACPSPRGGTFDRRAGCAGVRRARSAGRVVVKADGLAAGKGVTVCDDMAEAEAAIRACLLDGAFGDAGRTDRRRGAARRAARSASSPCATRRRSWRCPRRATTSACATATTGPNTGGMGAISPVDEPSDDDVAAILDAVHRPILAELARRGHAVPGRAVRGPDAHRRRPAAAGVQRPVRRSRDRRRTLPRLATPLAAAARWPSRDGRLAAAATAAGITGSLLPVAPSGCRGRGRRPRPGTPSAPRTGDRRQRHRGGSRHGRARVLRGRRRATAGDLVTAGGRVLVVVGAGTDRGRRHRARLRRRGPHRLAGCSPPGHRPDRRWSRRGSHAR